MESDHQLETPSLPSKQQSSDEKQPIENVEKSVNSTGYNGSLVSSGSNGSFVSGEEDFENDPDEKNVEKSVVEGQNGGFASGSDVGLSGHGPGIEGDDGIEKEDGGEVGDGIGGSVNGVGSEPVARVSKVEEEVSAVENGGEETKVDGGGKSGSIDEGDAVVDSINVDVVEAVRSGVAVVGVESSEVESKTIDSNEVKPTDEMGSAESKNVDVVEPVAIDDVEVGESKEGVVESGNKDSPVVEESSPAVSTAVEGDSSGEGVKEVEEWKNSGKIEEEVEKSVTDESSVLEESIDDKSVPLEGKVTETDLVKSTGEEDSVVDQIKVDHVEVVRSGVAVVGDPGGEAMDTAVKEIEVNSELVANDDKVEPTEHEEHKVGGEDVKPETDIDSKEHQPAGELEVASGGDEGKVEADYADNKPQSTSVEVRGEEIKFRSYADVLLGGSNAGDSDKTHGDKSEEKTETPSPKNGGETEDKNNSLQEETDGNQLVEELDRAFSPPEGVEGSQIVTDSEEEADSDEEGEEKEMFDSAALAALLKAATGSSSDSGTITITSQDGSRLFSVERPAGLGASLRSVRPASRPSNSSLVTPSSLAASSEENLSEEEKKKLQHMHQLRVKFLRLVQRVGYTAEDSVAAQVLYRLTLLAGRPTSPTFSIENAKQTATQLEAEGKDDLDFSMTILVIGKTGVGKSATINSIFGEEKVKINAFEPETTSVNEINGIIDGVKVRVIDVPGLKSSGMEQGFNRRILASVKKITKKYPPEIMLYVDRLDSQTRDLNDLPLLRTITSSLGNSIWRSAIVTLTHAACAPPDGPSGSPLSYEVFVAQRSHIVQQLIGQAVGDLRLMNPSLMNPVSLVENHPACRKNREGQRVLPNGQAWRPQLLLLSYSMKILAEASSALKPQDPFDHRKLFGFRVRSAPLPYLLSSMLQPRTHPKLPADQGGDNGDSDIDLDDLSDSDHEEEEDEYDQLPPFKPLRKSQITKLSKDQKKAYFEEYDYRVKLLQRKQWREELKRMKEMKKRGNTGMDGYGEIPEDFDAENEAPAAVPVPLPDMVLPPSFDSDNPAYRYRFLEPTSQFLARPVLDTHGWDHDCGYDGVNLEQNLGIAGSFPAAVTVQVTKDKKECNLHLDSAVSAKHGENGSSLVGFDIQTIGKQPAYIIRGESKLRTLKKNKTGAGVAVTFLGENVATGVKVEDQLNVGKRLVFLGSAGTVRSQKDAAYGANLEVRLREADYPIGQDQSSLNLSLMKWRGDLAVGGNLQSQISVGRNSKMAVRVSLNNKLSGQVSVRTSSSDHLQLALAGLIPIALSIYRNFKPSASENYSLY